VRDLPKLNAVDSISPAFNLTKTNLFNPFRWGFWVRIGILGFLTGEMSSGGGCNFNAPANWNRPRHDQLLSTAPNFPNIPHVDPHVLWAVLPIIVITILVLALIFTYIASVCRFILLEGILNGQVSIRDGWSRWQSQGIRYFIFKLLFGLLFLVVIGTGGMILLMMLGVASWGHTGVPPASAIAGLIFGALLLFLLALPFILVQLFAKDFAVPVMALEGTTFGEAWRRVWAMITSEPLGLAGYVGMKIVLAIAAGIAFGVVSVIALLVLAIPVGIVGVMAFFAGKAAGLGIGPLTITLIVAAGVVLLACILFVIALIHVPVAMFFPAYGLYFFAGRYQPLHDRLFPPPPMVPDTPPEPPPMPEPPPEPLAT
jgi:hypothetical protein